MTEERRDAKIRQTVDLDPGLELINGHIIGDAVMRRTPGVVNIVIENPRCIKTRHEDAEAGSQGVHLQGISRA